MTTAPVQPTAPDCSTCQLASWVSNFGLGCASDGQAIAEERSLISTHDSSRKLFELKGRDYERYLVTLREKRADWCATDEAENASEIA